MKKYTLAVVSWACFSAAVSQAQDYYLPPGAGLYFRAGVGPSFYQDGRLTYFGYSGGTTSGANAPVKYDTGVAANVAVGWAFNRYISADFETGYQGTQINYVPGYTQFHSDVYDMPFLANVTLSCPIPRTIVVPYIGVGAGGADTFFDAHSLSDNADPALGTVYGHENDVEFAWQAFAGLRFQLAPNVTLGAEYQYFTTADTTYSYNSYPPPNFNVGFDGVRTHSVLFTFEWKFW
ncbi:MAG TPA: outer membrane beta-barrel protein [Verrucomicrobiae bacterium]|nr:outer membrane beta-barrel protein [Verrucomicrobiae bacterium]